MSDEFCTAWSADSKKRKARWKAGNLERARELDDGKWTKHSDVHWSRTLRLPGNPYEARLDYWPSTDRMRVDDLSGECDTESNAFEKLKEMGIDQR